MTEENQAKLAQLPELIVDAVDAVDQALEEKSRERVARAHERRAAAEAAYAEVLQAAEGAERMQIEQRFGRRITDLRRQASRLPQGAMGRKAELAPDAGFVPFIEQRTPGRSMQEFASPSRRDEKPRYTTGGEVEAWCGPCGGMRTHNIYAMVGGEPQQVICKSCGGKHGFRTSPARKAPGSASEGGKRSSSPTREQQEADRRQKDKMALRDELMTATQVRTFSPKERYKAGEIIEHPEHGRGKIENVTRGSVLVRFLQGIRPLDLG